MGREWGVSGECVSGVGKTGASEEAGQDAHKCTLIFAREGCRAATAGGGRGMRCGYGACSSTSIASSAVYLLPSTQYESDMVGRGVIDLMTWLTPRPMYT